MEHNKYTVVMYDIHPRQNSNVLFLDPNLQFKNCCFQFKFAIFELKQSFWQFNQFKRLELKV